MAQHDQRDRDPAQRRGCGHRRGDDLPEWRQVGAGDYSASPFAGWPFRRNVLGSSPSPQILNDAKSLYQGPSGASGSDSRQSLSL